MKKLTAEDLRVLRDENHYLFWDDGLKAFAAEAVGSHRAAASRVPLRERATELDVAAGSATRRADSQGRSRPRHAVSGSRASGFVS
jgi:hypothetical protein